MSNIFFRTIRFPFRLFGYDVVKQNIPDPIIDKDEVFCQIYAICKPYTMTSKERMYALYKSVEYIAKKEIPGDIVECGVWRGGSTMLIALSLLHFNIDSKNIYLYDTFEGMSEPTDDDFSLDNKVNAKYFWNKKKKDNINLWCFGSLQEVQQNMFLTQYPQNKLVFVKGKVEETIPGIIPDKISLLRLDTDWYESTKHELQHLFPLLVKEGILIIDDYGHWAGAKKACDEYFDNEAILLNRIDYTGRIALKY